MGWKSLLQGIRGADRAGFGARVFPRTKIGRREVEEAPLREPLEEERRKRLGRRKEGEEEEEQEEEEVISVHKMLYF